MKDRMQKSITEPSVPLAEVGFETVLVRRAALILSLAPFLLLRDAAAKFKSFLPADCQML